MCVKQNDDDNNNKRNRGEKKFKRILFKRKVPNKLDDDHVK